MATEDTARTIMTQTRGGSPYLQSYLKPAEDAQSAQFERGLQMSREEREQSSFERENQKSALAERRASLLEGREARQAKRQEFMENWRMRQEERAADLDVLKYRKQEAADEIAKRATEDETHAAEAIAKISNLDEHNMGFGYNARQILADKSVTSALAGKHGKAVKAALDEQTAKHENILQHFQAQAADAGLAGDVRQFADKTGQMDEVKFSSALETARQAKQEKERAAAEQMAASDKVQAAQLGLVPVAIDEKTHQVRYGTPKPTPESINDLVTKPKNPAAVEGGSTLPTQTKQGTSATQQPSEGTRVKQNGKTYEFRGGSYVPVD